MILRGIDYLPPGEVTFADYGRAILAADQAAFPDDDEWRRYIRKEFVRRGIVARARDLRVETSFRDAAVAAVDLQGLVDSQWVAYTFAEQNRKLLKIPKDAQFEVLPRTVVTKRLRPFTAAVERASAVREDTSADDLEQVSKTAPPGTDGGDLPTVKELLFKVRWSITEPNPPDLAGIARERRVQTGTTLVIDWDNRIIRSLLGPLDLAARRPARDAMLRRLVDQGLLGVTRADALDAMKHTLGTGVEGVVTGDVLRVRGTGRLLHVARDVALSDLVVRVYNVRFGDAVLVSIPEKAGGHDVERHVLFDFGNALNKAGGVDTVFEPSSTTSRRGSRASRSTCSS